MNRRIGSIIGVGVVLLVVGVASVIGVAVAGGWLDDGEKANSNRLDNEDGGNEVSLCGEKKAISVSDRRNMNIISKGLTMPVCPLRDKEKKKKRSLHHSGFSWPFLVKHSVLIWQGTFL